MSRFPETHYEFFNFKDELLGEHNGLLGGLDLYPDTSYVMKFINNRQVQQIDICEVLTKIES